jgi:hypothetical protein
VVRQNFADVSDERFVSIIRVQEMLSKNNQGSRELARPHGAKFQKIILSN